MSSLGDKIKAKVTEVSRGDITTFGLVAMFFDLIDQAEQECATEQQRVNPFESACREWLKGCSVSKTAKLYAAIGEPFVDSPRHCPECTEAFLDHIEKLGGRNAV